MATLVQWQMGQLGPQVEATNIDGSDLSNPRGLGIFTVTQTGFTSDPVLGCTTLSGSTSADNAISTGSYWVFTITPLNDVTMSLTTLAFNAARDGSANPRGYVVRASHDSYASDLGGAALGTIKPNWTAVSIDLSGVAALQNIHDAVTFRMYVYAPTTGAWIDFDDLTISGTVSPVNAIAYNATVDIYNTNYLSYTSDMSLVFIYDVTYAANVALYETQDPITNYVTCVLLEASGDNDENNDLATTLFACIGSTATIAAQRMCFTDPEGVLKYDYEIGYFSNTSEEKKIECWIRIPSFDNTTRIRLWYRPDSSGVDETDANGTWENWQAVYHLDESFIGIGRTDLYDDSSPNDWDGSDYISATGKTGIYFDGQQFDGNNDYIKLKPEANALLPATGDFTVSAWVNATTAGMILSNNLGETGRTDIGLNSNNTLYVSVDDTTILTSSTSVVGAGWTHVAVVHENDDWSLYINGSWDAWVNSQQTIATDTEWRIGATPTRLNWFTGYIDELQIIEKALSADWIATAYNQGNDNDVFWTLYAEGSAKYYGNIILRTQNDGSYGALLYVRDSADSSYSALMYIRDTYDTTYDANVLLRTTENSVVYADVDIQSTNINTTYYGNIILYSTANLVYNADTLLKTTENVSYSGNVITKTQNINISFSGDCILITTSNVVYNGECILRTTSNISYSGDMYVRDTFESNYAASILLATTHNIVHYGNTLLYETHNVSYGANSILRTTANISYCGNVILRTTNATVYYGNIIVRTTNTENYNANVLLYETKSVAYNSNIILQDLSIHISYSGLIYLRDTFDKQYSATVKLGNSYDYDIPQSAGRSKENLPYSEGRSKDETLEVR